MASELLPPTPLEGGLDMKKTVFAWLGFCLVPFWAACAVEQDSSKDASAFRSAIPSAEQVKLSEPVAQSETSNPQSAFPGVGLQGTGGSPSQLAEYYRFTRTIFDGANAGTAWVLGTVKFIVAFPVTTLEGDTATWGPWTEALNPAEWRLVVKHLGGDKYSYSLEGRKKADGGAFQPVLTGTGYGSTHPEYGNGSFVFDHDVANQLDPARLKGPNDTGKLSVNHTLAKFPERTIVVEATPTNTEAKYKVTVVRAKEGGGSVDVISHDDIDETKKTAMEDMVIHSRWISTGAGRADVVIKNGDIPATIGAVNSSECWSENFSSTFYQDSQQFKPTSGSESSCPFPTAEFK
jgi:hypothetical protein